MSEKSDERFEEMHEVELSDEVRDLLRQEFTAPEFPEHEIEVRLDSSIATSRSTGSGGRDWSDRLNRRSPNSFLKNPFLRGVLATAAALVLFVGGAEYGRRTAVPVNLAETEFQRMGSPALSVPVSIQSAGSDYVAALAQFTSQSGALAPEEREEARQVALAVLYGAVVELLNDSQDDDMLETIAQLVFSRRQAVRNPEAAGAIWF